MRPILVAHGLEGSPEGAKVQAFRAAGLTVVAPDGREQPLAARVAQIRDAVVAHPDAVVVGSSYGGLAAAAVVHALGNAHGLAGLVLLAPALQWREAPVDDPRALHIPESLSCTVFHGQNDRIVPLAGSEALAARCPHVQLVVTDDGHRLSKSLPEIVAHVRRRATA